MFLASRWSYRRIDLAVHLGFLEPGPLQFVPNELGSTIQRHKRCQRFGFHLAKQTYEFVTQATTPNVGEWLGKLSHGASA